MSQLIALLPPTPVATTTPVATSSAPLQNETDVGLDLVADGSLDGHWKVFVSCAPLPPNPSDPAAGADVTAGITSPNVAAVDHTNALTQRQFVQTSIGAGWIWVVFTPTSGTGKVSAFARIGP